MTDNISTFPTLRNINNPIFRQMIRRAIAENRQMPKLNLPESTVGKLISFRKMQQLPRLGKEDPVDG